MRDDRRRPVDGVDLRHQRSDHEPRLVVQIVVGELRVRRMQVVADRVVLPHEQRVQQCQPHPEVPRDTADVDVRLDLVRDQPLPVELQLAVLAGSKRGRECGIATVDLRPDPTSACRR